MSQHSDQPSDPTARPTSRVGRRFVTGLLTGGVLGSLLAGSVNVFSHPMYGPGGWWHGRGAWGEHRHARYNADMASERLAFFTDWVLTRIQAHDEQRQRIKTIVQEAANDFTQVREQHHSNRQALLEALGQATVDRDALQTVRAAEVQLIDAASTRLVNALADIADTLTPEQRTSLVTFAAQHRH